MKKLKIILAIGGILFFSSITAKEQKYANLQELISNKYKIKISGEVVDKQGNSIDNLELEIRETIDGWSGKNKSYKKKLKGSTFSITSTVNCQNLLIMISHKDYYTKDISIPDYRKIEAGKVLLDNNTIAINSQKIILEPMGEITKAVKELKILGKLNAARIETPDRTALELIMEYPFWGKNRLPERNSSLIIAKKESDLPENIIYLWPEYNKNGLPESLTLKANIPNCGFKYMKGVDYTSFRKEMKMAPETGYQSEIKIENVNVNSEEYFYYVYLDGYYGKMSVSIGGLGYNVSIYLNTNNKNEKSAREINPSILL